MCYNLHLLGGDLSIIVARRWPYAGGFFVPCKWPQTRGQRSRIWGPCPCNTVVSTAVDDRIPEKDREYVRLTVHATAIPGSSYAILITAHSVDSVLPEACSPLRFPGHWG